MLLKSITLALENLEHPSEANIFLSALIFRKNGNQARADQIMNEKFEKNSTSSIVKWCQAYYSGRTDEAKNIAKQLGDGEAVLKLLIRSIDQE